MSGVILNTAAELIAAGVSLHALDAALPAALDQKYGAWAEAVFAGKEVPDPDRLAILVAAGCLERDAADRQLDRDAEAAVEEMKHRLLHPDIGDDLVQIRRDVDRLEAVRTQRQRAWDNRLGRADFEFDATVTYTDAAPAEAVERPTSTLEEASKFVEVGIQRALSGRGPRHVLIEADPGTRKTSTMIRLTGQKVAERRAARHRWIQNYRRDNPGADHAEAARKAEAAGLHEFRVIYFGESHELVARTVDLARECGMSAEHHGGLDRGFDPADPASPPICTQPERVKQTRLAGESVPDKACGRAGGPGCPDRDGCRKWQRLANCGRSEFVGTTIDQAFAPFLPHELTGFDLTTIDEAPDRVGYGETEVPLDYMSDRHFDSHPVLGPGGEQNIAGNDLARAEFRLIRDILDTTPNGYAPMQTLRAAGFDHGRWLRLADLMNARVKPTRMTPMTSDEERRELARASFCRQIRALCALFRQLAEPGDGWVRLVDDGEQRRVIVRTIRTLHQSILSAPIIALDGSADMTSWRRFLPNLEVITAPRPRAPHETAVHIVRPNGKHAMRKPARKAFDCALVELYSRGSTGILTHKEHEVDFTGPNIITGHYGALTGRNNWKDCSTLLSFGLPFLSPEAAAYEGGGRSGEAVPLAMPRRALLPQMMKGGDIRLVPSMEYQHAAAHEGNAAVRDRQAIQGPGGRPRASARSADNPVLSIYVGYGLVPGMEFDCVITSAEQFAPDRFVRMAASGLVIASGLDRHRAHPKIYSKPHTAEYDVKREVGGLIATLERVLFPPWCRDRPREKWNVLRYWVDGRGNRMSGRLAACPAGTIAEAKRRLRETCGAVRFEIVGEVHPAASEVTRIPQVTDLTWILGTFPGEPTAPSLPFIKGRPDEDHPPDY